MLFFPYRADLKQWRFPWVTLMICAACAIVLANQFAQKSALQWHAVKACYLQADRELSTAMQVLAERSGHLPERLCKEILVAASVSDAPQQLIRQWAFVSSEPLPAHEVQQREYIDSVLQRSYAKFQIDAPAVLTENMWFDPRPENVSAVKMVTSIFAHINVWHLLGNLFFFFAFAATVELIVGSLSMLASVVLLALLTNCFYAFIATMEGVYTPTMGLSGIVFGMMGMFVCFLPHARVKCFLWLVVLFQRPAIPAWLLVGGYLLWNIYGWQVSGIQSNINFIVHISGALFGALIALLVFRISKQLYSTELVVRNSRRWLPANH